MVTSTYDLKPELRIPVAVRSVGALHEIGETHALGRIKDALVLVPHARTPNLARVPSLHLQRLGELHGDAQVWVRPESSYSSCNAAYSAASRVLSHWKPQARLRPRAGQHLDHILHKVAARHFSFFLVRLFPLSPTINMQYGRTWEKFLSGKKPSDSGGYPHAGAHELPAIYFADPIEISKVLEIPVVPKGISEKAFIDPGSPPYKQWYFQS